MKKCFGCDRNYPLFMFSVDKMKYQRPHDQGRVKVCRLCNYKYWSNAGWNWFHNPETGKFEKVVFKSKWEIIKRILKK
jgi:hypothetical protein